MRMPQCCIKAFAQDSLRELPEAVWENEIPSGSFDSLSPRHAGARARSDLMTGLGKGGKLKTRPFSKSKHIVKYLCC